MPLRPRFPSVRALTGAALLFAGMIAAPLTPARAADCPDTKALHAAGVTLTRNTPKMAQAYRYENGTLTSYRVDDPELGRPPKRERYDHPLAVSLQEMDGRSFALIYDDDPARLDQLPQLGNWRTPVSLKVDGETKDRGTISYAYRGTGSVQIGACRYDVWQVVERIVMGKLRTAFLKEFSPKAGLVLRVTKLDPETGKAQSQVAFDRIETRQK
ncbi:hypothetical protein [Thioclava electrotropha]|uniref:Uncharacterized protein n=1 Tax=Thioclava electrotropha TaxID=1549850 RepID=A0ABX6YUZ6_9RHOB|nr:hypothetical protein [Thioclava electrotropha]QPZ91689.1 hypothetical protein AKL02_012830 [Thioclava electrotropha]